MRSTILAALSMTFALAACGGEEPAPQPPPPPPPPPVEPVATTPPVDTTPPPPPPKPALAELIPGTLKAMHDAFNAHDAAKMATLVTDDVAVYDYGSGETHTKGEFQDGMTKLFGWFGDAKSEANRVFVKGNMVITELTWSATMTGDIMGMKATNKPVGGMRVHVSWYNDDGLVKEEHEYADGAGTMAQMQGKKGAPPVPSLPTSPPEMHIAGGNPDHDKLADWIKTGDDAFSSDDPKAVLAMTADDADYWINFGGPAMKGMKEMTAGLKDWFHAFPDQKWTVTHAWGIDGFAIVEHTMNGTQKGAVGPLRATGKPVTNWHWIDIQQPTADGKIQHGWGYANLVEMMAQTGALKHEGRHEDHPGGKPAGKPAPKK